MVAPLEIKKSRWSRPPGTSFAPAGGVNQMGRRPQPNKTLRLLSQLPVIGAPFNYVGERFALKRAVNAGRAWIVAHPDAITRAGNVAAALALRWSMIPLRPPQARRPLRPPGRKPPPRRPQQQEHRPRKPPPKDRGKEDHRGKSTGESRRRQRRPQQRKPRRRKPRRRRLLQRRPQPRRHPRQRPHRPRPPPPKPLPRRRAPG